MSPTTEMSIHRVRLEAEGFTQTALVSQVFSRDYTVISAWRKAGSQVRVLAEEYIHDELFRAEVFQRHYAPYWMMTALDQVGVSNG